MAPGPENPQLDKDLTIRRQGRLFGLFWAILLVFGSIWAFWHDGPDEKQKAKAQGLAYQILEIRRKSLQASREAAGHPLASPASRSPASTSQHALVQEGRIGKASDGKPYFYRLQDEPKYWIVEVWAESRPDHKTEVRIHKDQL